jgi:Protein of unknown function (DUF5818)
MVTITGVVEKKDIGMGAWALVADDGKTYELLDCPKDLKQEGLKVTVTGAIDDQMLTAAAIGPVLVISSFAKLN